MEGYPRVAVAACSRFRSCCGAARAARGLRGRFRGEELIKQMFLLFHPLALARAPLGAKRLSRLAPQHIHHARAPDGERCWWAPPREFLAMRGSHLPRLLHQLTKGVNGDSDGPLEES